MVLPRFVAAALAGEPLVIHDTGEQTRCFCDVRDVMEVLPRLLAAPACFGRVFNVGSDHEITILQLADAVTASLNAGTFGQQFTALRLHQPSFDLPELQTLRVSVVPKSLTIQNASRQHTFFDCAVDVGIQQKVDNDNRVDELLDLAQEITDHLRLQRLASYPQAAWLAIQHDPVVASEHLDQNRQLTSVLTVTYRVKR
jgi:dTDP-D-glucose 4,6-dehydratase